MAQLKVGTAKRRAEEQIKRDPFLSALLTNTPQENFAAVNNYVTDLNTAKEVLKRLTAAVTVLLNRID